MIQNERRTTVLRRTMLVAGVAMILAAPSWLAAHGVVAELVTFGDSLSDPGNAFALVGGTNVPPDYSLDPLLVPDRPYARGGHHFSNGPTWIEQLAGSIGLPADANPAFRGSGVSAHNFAIGGARARFIAGNGSLPEQVSAFFQTGGPIAPSDAVYVVEIGGNDERDALVVAAGGGNPAPIIVDAVASIATQVAALYAAGARSFFVWTAPNVGFTPAVNALGPGAVGAAAFISQQFNAGLDAALAGLGALPGVHIVRFDINALLAQIVASPASFGLTNVTTACIAPGVAPFECASPQTYLWWDGIHPTKAGHAIVARAAAQTLGLQP